jgi:diguanylate cyclase (GGDEF)-like protein
MIIAMSNSEYWRQQISLDSGLIIGIIILPMFYAVILRELEAANKELKKQIDVTSYAATHDSLTKLHNRFIFVDRLDQAIRRSARSKNYFAVLSINIDNFKHINDLFSYAGGDSVLRNVASRLRSALRSTDSAGRLGDDEFVVLLSDLTSRYSAREGTDRIAEIFKLPYGVGGKELAVTASIGISIFPDDADDVEALMHCANTAMLRAKKRGGNSIQSFSYIKYQLITEVS